MQQPYQPAQPQQQPYQPMQQPYAQPVQPQQPYQQAPTQRVGRSALRQNDQNTPM